MNEEIQQPVKDAGQVPYSILYCGVGTQLFSSVAQYETGRYQQRTQHSYGRNLNNLIGVMSGDWHNLQSGLYRILRCAESGEGNSVILPKRFPNAALNGVQCR